MAPESEGNGGATPDRSVGRALSLVTCAMASVRRRPISAFALQSSLAGPAKV
jgi:hypothetical protein